MNMWRKFFGTVALAFMICLTGLVMSGEAQAERFVDNGNETVTDTQTGLMWTKNANLFNKRTWIDALVACRTFSISEIRDWLLPGRDQLEALYHAMKSGHPFTGVQSSYYWSGTFHDKMEDHMWGVSMDNGFMSALDEKQAHHVWCFRR